jgi:hypothetical protein
MKKNSELNIKKSQLLATKIPVTGTAENCTCNIGFRKKN